MDVKNHTFTCNDFKYEFIHNFPSNDYFDKLNIQQAYPKIYITMNVYNNENNFIFSVKLDIEGNYYCTGNKNFEYDKISSSMNQYCDDTIFFKIIDEFNDNRNTFETICDNTIMNVWKSRIFDEIEYYSNY
jgi:hypothetical protein